MRADDSPPARWKQLTARLPLLAPVAIVVVLAVLREWAVALPVAGMIAAFMASQLLTRRRSRRANAALHGSGQGCWDALIPVDALDWLRAEESFPFWRREALRNGLPVRLSADSSGLHLRIRGLLATRLIHWSPLTIPWKDIAGARESDQGWTTESRKVSMLRLTRITIDVVGASYRYWSWDWDDDDDHEGVGADEPDEDDDQTRQEDQEDLQLLREDNGPDWREGTAPLVVTTTAPEGLTDLVNRWAAGEPVPTI